MELPKAVRGQCPAEDPLPGSHRAEFCVMRETRSSPVCWGLGVQLLFTQPFSPSPHVQVHLYPQVHKPLLSPMRAPSGGSENTNHIPFLFFSAFPTSSAEFSFSKSVHFHHHLSFSLPGSGPLAPGPFPILFLLVIDGILTVPSGRAQVNGGPQNATSTGNPVPSSAFHKASWPCLKH